MEDFDPDIRKRELEDDNDSNAGVSGFVAILSVLFLPAFALAWGLYYFLLRQGRQKRSVIFMVAVTIIAIALGYGTMVHALDTASLVLYDITNIMETWTYLIPLLVVVNLVLGSIGGVVMTFVQVGRMIHNPHLLQVGRSWTKDFEFRMTPWEIWKRNKTIEGLKNGEYSSVERAPMGITEKEFFAPSDYESGLETKHDCMVAYRYQSDANLNTLVTGNTGSGKSITLQSMMLNDIRSGTPLIMIDMKRDPRMASKLAAWCKEHDRPFYHFSNGDPRAYDIPNSPGQAHYDPLINGGSSKSDMLLNMRKWDTASEVYKSNVRQLLQVLFQMLKQADRTKTKYIDWNHGGLSQVASALKNNSAFTDLVEACEGRPIYEDAKDVDAGIKTRNSHLSNAVEQVRGNVRTLMASDYGPWLRTGGKDSIDINLFELTKDASKGAVILFSINSDSERDFAEYIGSLIMSDLSAVSALRRNQGISTPLNLYIDEFQVIPPQVLAGLLEKARASGISTTLSSQSLEQIISSTDKNGEAYLKGIMDTCANYFVHAGSQEESAERFAKLVGRDKFNTYSSTNENKSHFWSFNWNNRRDSLVRTEVREDYVVRPEEFMELSLPVKSNGYKATAIVITKVTSDPNYSDIKRPLARRVHMIPDEAVLQEYYVPGRVTFNEDEYYSDDQDVHLTVDSEEQVTDSQSSQGPSDDEILAAMESYESMMHDSAGYEDEEEDGGFGWGEDDESQTVQESFSINPHNLSGFDNNNNSFENSLPEDKESVHTDDNSGFTDYDDDQWGYHSNNMTFTTGTPVGVTTSLADELNLGLEDDDEEDDDEITLPDL